MANALAGKTSVTCVWIVPTQEGVDALRNFFDDHANFMGVKSYQHGPLRLIHYFISEGPEWVDHDPIFEGKYPEKTGRTVFTLTEIYETDDGLFHHRIESNDFRPEFAEIASAHKITGHSFSHLKVTHSLWD